MALKHVIAAAQRAARQVAGTAVVYRRGDQSAQLSATIGQTTVVLDDGDGTRVRAQVRDFIIQAVDLVLDDESVVPRDGDVIEEQSEGLTLLYEVMPIAGEPSWRYSDPLRQAFRIHTKQITDQ